MPCFAMQTTQLMFAQMPLRVITNEKEENIQLKKEIDCKAAKSKKEVKSVHCEDVFCSLRKKVTTKSLFAFAKRQTR